ncbi:MULTISPECIES: ZIP family zinc transporter [unclassified Salinibacterium]|uniref:ZIP family metal transporter n=1 Tax=unclassified Salinibacterium TaxID=2632331 RepID=UPI001424A1E4|nr:MULTISPECIES: ZIP family zinc transporter [unclassified Salinibacterium]
MADALLAGGIGLAAGCMLVVGALIGWFVRVPQPVVAGVMAFGAGVFISTLAFELVEEANRAGGLFATVAGFLVGAVVYVAADTMLSRRGARHRMHHGDRQTAESEKPGSGRAIAIGALLDGVPESIVLGVSVAAGATFSVPIFVAIAVSNLPEGLSSSSGMKASKRSAAYVFGVWGGIALASGVAALVGFLLFADASGSTVAFVTTIAAGAILAMLTNTMIPEAFEGDHTLTGLVATIGFLAAFVLHDLG